MTDALPRRKTYPDKDPAVPKIELLRGSAATVVGRVFNDLQQRFPPPSPLVYHLITSDEAAPLSTRHDLLKVFRRWSDISDATKDEMETGTAVHHRTTREIALLRHTMDRFESRSSIERAKGVYILAHEYWHVLRVIPSTLAPDPFEEGSADLFSVIQTFRLTGYEVRPPVLAYSEYMAEVQEIIQTVAPTRMLDWLLESRHQPDLDAWVKNELDKSKSL